MGGESKNWPKAKSIIRIGPDDKQETVLEGKNWAAFATNHDVAFACDGDAGLTIQVVENGESDSR